MSITSITNSSYCLKRKMNARKERTIIIGLQYVIERILTCRKKKENSLDKTQYNKQMSVYSFN